MTLYFENEYTASPVEKLFPFDPVSLAETVVRAVLESENCPYDAELSLTLTDDERIREINLDTRGIDSATDVLSFPMVSYSVPAAFSEAEEDKCASFNVETGCLLLGDIVISCDRVIAQASLYGHSVRREYAFLIAHSVLHLVGYDHMTEDEEKIMLLKQEQILNSLGITRQD